MKTDSVKINRLCGLALGAWLILGVQPATAADPLKALIVDGQNNHNWQATTPILKAALESSGRFTVDVATSPPHQPRRRLPEAANGATPPPVRLHGQPWRILSRSSPNMTL